MPISRRVLLTGAATGLATLVWAPVVAPGLATTRKPLLSHADWASLVGQRFTLGGDEGDHTATLLEATEITRRQSVPGEGELFALRFRVHGTAVPVGLYTVSCATTPATPLLFTSASQHDLVAIINRWHPTNPQPSVRSL